MGIVILRLLVGIALIIIHLIAGNFIVAWAALPVPGSVVGMVLMTLSLRAGLIDVSRVMPASDLLLRHMALFFVPPGVALMLYFDLLATEWPAIVVAAIVSTFVVLVVVGWTAQKLEADD